MANQVAPSGLKRSGEPDPLPESKRRRLDLETIDYTSIPLFTEAHEEELIERLNTVSRLGTFILCPTSFMHDQTLKALHPKAASLRVLKIATYCTFSEESLL